ncbi:MAG TPA: PKD domain-containing protein [Solirubrobacterales bacterium]|nr:PKD domain-containing protein [Solirubrobacterales bacterium]
MFSDRVKRAGGGAVALLAIAGASAVPASARDGYVANNGSATVSVFDASSDSPVTTIPVGTGPRDVAITPNGQLAYVTNETEGTVSVINTATNSVVSTIPVGSKPRGVAVAPDGQSAWVANSGDGTVSVIDTATNSVSGSPIHLGEEPDGVAISPDGGSVFVAQRKGGNVAILSSASRAVTGTVTDALGPDQIAIGPHGGRAYVTNSGSNSVTAFDPANGQLSSTPIPVGSGPSGIAIGPSGTLAYAAGSGSGTLTPINTATDAAGTAITGLNEPVGVAVSPDGSQGYVSDSGGGVVTAFNTSTNAPSASIPAGSAPSGVAIVPDQPPSASFTVAPQKRIQGRRLTFRAGSSKDPDGSIATYAWEFGDGKHLRSSKATVNHTYAQPGTYTATLTLTDNEGCSTTLVYSGQTASCNGSAVARATATIVVAGGTGPVLELGGGRRQRIRGSVRVFAQCPQEACNVVAGGTVVMSTLRGRRAVTVRRRIGSATASLSAGQWDGLALRFSPGVRRALRRALRSGGAANAQLSVAATGAGGLQTTHPRFVELVGPRRHRRHRRHLARRP